MAINMDTGLSDVILSQGSAAWLTLIKQFLFHNRSDGLQYQIQGNQLTLTAAIQKRNSRFLLDPHRLYFLAYRCTGCTQGFVKIIGNGTSNPIIDRDNYKGTREHSGADRETMLDGASSMKTVYDNG